MADNMDKEQETPQAGGSDPSKSEQPTTQAIPKTEKNLRERWQERKQALPKPDALFSLPDSASLGRGVVEPTKEEAAKANETRGPLEEDLSTKEKIAYASLVASGAALAFAANAPAIVEAVGLRDSLDSLPPGSFEFKPDSMAFGGRTPETDAALNEVLAGYRNAGVPDHLSVGIQKGAFYLKGPDGRWYEVDLAERGIYHVADGKLQRSLTLRDLLMGRVQLDTANQKFFDLPTEALNRLAQRQVAGEPNSDSPTFPLMRPHVTLIGAENYDNNMVGQPALKSMDKNGNVGTVSADVPRLAIGNYDNGHNVPQATVDFINQNYGSKAVEILGRPISDPYWMNLVIRGQRMWVLSQWFERGSVSFNPQNPSNTQFEGGLDGNHLTFVLYGAENLPPVGGPYPTPIPTKTPEPTPTKTPESKWGLTAGDGWGFYNEEGAPLSMRVTNRQELDKIRQILGPGNPGLELAIVAKLETAQSLYGVDPALFKPFNVPDAKGGYVVIGKKVQMKDAKGNGIFIAQVDPDKWRQALNEVVLKNSFLIGTVGTLFATDIVKNEAIRSIMFSATRLEAI